MSRLRLVLPALVLALAFGLAACGDDDEEGDGAEAEITGGETTLDLTIGDSIPLTGDLADFGPPGQKAADLAVEEINAAIEEVGADHTVEVIHEDNETNPQAAVQVARSMVDDGASCITGAWASADTIPTARSVSIREGILQISPASTADEITTLEDDGLLNRTSPPDSFQGPTLANYMDEELGGAEGLVVNVAGRNDAYGEGLTGTFSEAWEGLGGEIGLDGEPLLYDPEQPSYNSEAQEIVSGNPDATVIVDFPETYARVGPALVRAGFDPESTFFTDGLASSGLPADAGEEATNGMRGTAPGTPEEDPATIAFDELYTQAEPRDVERQTFDAQNFDAVVLCYLTAVAAGSTEGTEMAAVLSAISSPGGTEYTWEELPDAIEALQNGEDIDYQGAAGALDINEDGDATAGVYDIYTFRNGKIEIIDEIPVAQPD
jgi:ABC-type branched-subunit amino acid transport system substrate-binding protein